MDRSYDKCGRSLEHEKDKEVLVIVKTRQLQSHCEKVRQISNTAVHSQEKIPAKRGLDIRRDLLIKQMLKPTNVNVGLKRQRATRKGWNR